MLAYLPFPGYSHVADDSVSSSDPVENVPREKHSVRFFLATSSDTLLNPDAVPAAVASS